MYYDPSGHIAFWIGVAISAAIGALYGGLTASITGQNVGAGIFIGLIAGGIMGLGAGIASSLFYSVYIAEAASIAGNLLWGSVVAFVSGFLGGAGSEAASQWVNNGSIDDMDSVIRSGIQWGVVNVVSAFAVSIANPKVTSEVAVATAVFGSAIGALGMLFDVIRNKKTLPKPRSKTHTQQSYIS